MNTFPQPGQAAFNQFAGQGAAPQPQQFAAAPQQFGAPPGAAAPQPLLAPGAAFGPGAFDGTTLVGHQDPTPTEGDYVFEIVETLLKTLNGRTHITKLRVLDAQPTQQFSPQLGQQPPSAVGSDVSAPQKLDGSQWSFKYGTAAIMAMTLAMTGFTDEAAFKAAIPNWSPLMNALCDSKQKLAGNDWPPNPLAGRRARCAVRFSGAFTKKDNKPIMRFNWSVLTA